MLMGHTGSTLIDLALLRMYINFTYPSQRRCTYAHADKDGSLFPTPEWKVNGKQGSFGDVQ